MENPARVIKAPFWHRIAITTGQKVVIGFLIALLPLLAMGWFSFQTPRQYIRLSDSCRQSQQVVERLASFLSDIKDLETGQRGYLLTANARYLEPFSAAKAAIEPQLDELRRLTAGNAANEERLNKLAVLVHSKLAELERTIDLRRNDPQHGFDEALQIGRIPVVVMTSSKAEEDVIRTYDLHANCYVTKPVDLDQFRHVVKSISEFWFALVRLPSSEPVETACTV